jgi:hypothetical protein
MSIKVSNKQPDGLLQKQHIIPTQIIKDYEQSPYEAYETYTDNIYDRKLKYLISILVNIKPIIKTDIM